MKNVAQLASNQLTLRRFEEKDCQDFIGLVTTEPFGKYSPFGREELEAAKTYFNEILNKFSNTSSHPNEMEFQIWSIIDNLNKHFAGFIGYQSVIFEDATYSMFFWTFFEKYWQNTFPLQAGQLVCHYAFNNGIEKLIAFVNPQDIETIALVSKMNFSLIREASYFGITMFLFCLEKDAFQK